MVVSSLTDVQQGVLEEWSAPAILGPLPLLCYSAALHYTTFVQV